eukprot:198787_1
MCNAILPTVLNHIISPAYSLPKDITTIIIQYCDISGGVFRTDNDIKRKIYFNRLTDEDKKMNISTTWKVVDAFKDKHITKIFAGNHHELFLESNGVLWSCGSNQYGQCGLSHERDQREPHMVMYFVNNKIKIKDIHCGYYHNLAIDFSGKVYGWGDNRWGQCGISSVDTNIFAPKLITYLSGLNIIEIQCGMDHSYAMSDYRKHFLFGSNFDNQCVARFDVFGKCIIKPHCINDAFERHSNGVKNGKLIKSVHLGARNTKVILICVD